MKGDSGHRRFRINEAMMNTSNNTILITGGTSGIRFELATQLLALSNTVIITGRDQAKLHRIKKEQTLLHTIQSDVKLQANFREVMPTIRMAGWGV
jgi:short-subunit dehydrogenase involved in D-alanine esterification of teichoic acids